MLDGDGDVRDRPYVASFGGICGRAAGVVEDSAV